MSQPPLIPEDAPYAEAIPMAYAMPSASDARPTIVTVLGISSIIVSVIQVGVAITVCCMAFALWILSVVPPHQPSPPIVASVNWPDGLPIHIAAPLTNRLTELASLTPARRASLDALLRHSGRDIAPTIVNGNVTAATVKGLLISHSKTSDGHDVLNLPTGRIELSDTDATFEPGDSTEIITVETAEMALNAVAPRPAQTQPTTAPAPLVVISSSQMLTWYGTSIASGLLSILLLIAGILTLRGRKGGRRAHLWWASLKLPIAVAGAVGVAWMFAAFAEVGAAANGTNASSARGGIITFGVIQGAMSVGYIVAVFVILNLAHVRAWFATRR